MTAATITSAVRLNTATITQYLNSQPKASLTPEKRRVVLLRAAPVWDGPAQLPWSEGRHTQVAVGPSPLAVYELVLAHQAAGAPGPEVLVILTDREEAELGPDLLSKVHRQRVSAVNIWDVVREAFGADATDHWLSEENWAAESLLDATPPGGWPRLAGGTLSQREALAALAMRRLGIGRYDPDLAPGQTAGADGLDVHALLRWSLQPGGPDRYLALRAPERAGLARFLGEDDQVGLTGRALIALVDAGHGPDAVAFGLVCAALWRDTALPDAVGGRRSRGRKRTDEGSARGGESVDAEDYRARGRAERWFGDEPPAHGEALDLLTASFGRACEEFVSALLLSGRSEFDEAAVVSRRMSRTALDRADSLVRQFAAERAARSSPLLAAGLEARFAAVGQALTGNDPQLIARSVSALGDHGLANDTDARTRIARAGMAQRLSQWLAGDPPVSSQNVATAIGRQIAETGWVDLALDHIEAGGESEPTLRAAYDTLCASVRARRREIDRRFAQALATWTADGGAPDTMLTVEAFLPRVVAPVVKSGERAVLLLVLDGMSAAIAAELGEELRGHWVEYDPLADAKDAARRRAMASALPTLTAVSRTSLFAAELTSGTQADEKRAFPAHRFWGDAKAAVFHKDDLRAETAGDPFGPELLTALGEEGTHVAVVLNTIDDRLAKEQKLGDATWRLAEIGQLRELLRFAALQGRAVILTSDHGHVVDRHGMRLEADVPLSARHREPGSRLADPEVLLAGPRVVVPGPGGTRGGEVVALWDADSRYTAQKAGYHGGASLAEVAIPVLAFLPFGAQPPKGWRELADQRPSWWCLDAASVEARAPVTAVAGPASERTASHPVAPQPAAEKSRHLGGNKGAKDAVEIVAGRDSLFDMVLVPAENDSLLSVTAVPADEPTSPSDALMTALLASEIYQAQVQVLARKRELPRMEQAVRVLLDDGGTLPMTALAQRVGLPVTRSAEGFCAVLRQLLNYDGAQVLETLPDGRTLRLNTGLLKSQFELG
ncbi:BREX-2 system phosphatase PglZ [Streptomyces sp. NBC_00268]|uniref:BREX-2 system phosphatase PglZ n=1 Tax=Streptomyces sp. NBC_00268 TaxID=2975695 RepID=UPI0022598F28|nr:BREX-2 system phosphatase PglZ [Streptomyces sp. NBC_00268]MCX5184247.1 BREX-2 system phosphatase PglZ [Streptomyces sp. NBC_00268]